MPTRTKNAHGRPGETSEPPTKRARFDVGENDRTANDNASGTIMKSIDTENTAKRARFMSGGEIRAALKNPNPTALVDTLMAVRNQLTITPSEGPVAPQDARLLLAQHWMEISPGAQDLFNLWDTTNPRQPALPAIIILVLACILSLLTTHYTHHASGHTILKMLLTPPYLQKLNSYLGGGNNDLILATLKLYCAMSDFGSGREKKTILEGFGWEIKAIPKLLTMRRRGKTDDTDTLKRPDIRTLFIFLLLSFIAPTTPSSTKSLFLTQHADVFNHVFKGLVQDHYNVIRKVFETIWAGVWADPKVGRALKVGMFGENTINHILKLYDRSTPESLSADAEEEIPADLAHHFLLAICTRPGVGICFRDRGWYPRESDSELKATAEDDDGAKGTGRGKIFNKILSNIVKGLKVNEDARHQELASKILTACPELVAGYWPAAALTLEPRLSSRWLANIAFMGSVISLPVPGWCFVLPTATASSTSVPLYNPIPPPLSALLENSLPNVNTKTHFTKGLQSASGLVQHCSAVALVKCLEKYRQVQRELRKISEVLGEEDAPEGGSGLWNRRAKDLEREARRRVPEFMVVVAFASGASTAPKEKEKEGEKAAMKEPNEMRKALLAEAAQRLMKVYQQCFPAVALEAKFDVGKLLLGFEEAEKEGDGEEEEEGKEEEPAKRLDRVKQLHVLKLLQESEQFIWTGKAGSITYLRILLTHLTKTCHTAIHQALFSLVTHLLSTSTLFSTSSPEEAALWLQCLPQTKRSVDAESPDGAKLTDEPQAVVTFLDDCVSRCGKVVYKYLEELDGLCQLEEGERERERSETHPSPLLITVLEQLDAKMARKLLTPSDALATATFVRKLVLRLCGLLSDLRLVRAFVEKVDMVFSEDRLWKEYPVVSTAIRGEVAKMRRYCRLDEGRDVTMDGSEDVGMFLDAVEKVPVATSKAARLKAAHELVDWFRLVSEPLNAAEFKRLATAVSSLNPPELAELAQYTEPRQGLLWESMELVSRFRELCSFLTFEWIFMDAGPAQITDEGCRTSLTEALFIQKPKLVDVKRAVRLVTQWLTSSTSSDVKKALYLLLASISTVASSTLAATDIDDLKEMLFVRAGIVKETMMSSSVETDVDEGLAQLVSAALNAASPADRKIAFEISDHWLTVVRNELVKEGAHEVKAAYRWMKFLNPADLFDLMDNFANSNDTSPRQCIGRLLKEVLDALSLSAASQTEIETSLVHRLPQLLSLWRVAPDSATLERLIAAAVDGSLPVGTDGRLLRAENFNDASLVLVVNHASARLSHIHTLTVPAGISVEQFLTKSRWTDSTTKIISGLLYRKYIFKDKFVSWLSTGAWLSHKEKHIIPVLIAFLDTCNCASDQLSGDNASLWTQTLTYAVQVNLNDEYPSELRTAASCCVLLLLELCPSSRAELVDHLLQALEKAPIKTLTPEIVTLGCRLQTAPESAAAAVITAIVDRGIQWSTRALGNDEDAAAATEILEVLSDLLQVYGKTKPHLVETLITVVTQQRLANVEAIKLAIAALQTPLKPVVVNRFIQTITQHPRFPKLCISASLENSPREAIVNFLYELFMLHPGNTCQVSHIQPLIRIYHGTVSSSDLKILVIFQLFEGEKKISVAPLLNQWSPTLDAPSTTSLEAIQSFDSVVMFRTCLNIPSWRRLEKQVTSGASRLDSQLYDPVFVMLMFTQMLNDCPPTNAFGWVELFRTNAVGLLIRTLSSKDGAMRDVALSQIVALWTHLESADLQEKPHILRILSLLKNVYSAPTNDEPPKRLPSYTTLVLMHALRGVFYPSNFIYPLTARFLLQRPELDTSDVPMLYGMLYSSSDDWKKERGWILRFLSDGMLSRDDWAVFKRRHTWDLLASLFQSSENDRTLRHGVFEVLANLTANPPAATSLVLKSSLLSWMEMNVRGSRSEQIEWVKIIENLLVTLDASKIETATSGQWRGAICRCLSLLLVDGNGGSFPLIVPLILRLSLLPGPTLPGLSSLLDHAVEHLEDLERTVSIPHVSERVKVQTSSLPCPPHRAHGLHEPPNIENHLQTWGQSIEMLWRAAMRLKDKPKSWEALTSRLLVWRAIVGGKASLVGEWARTEAIRNIL